MNILIVDDATTFRKLLSMALQSLGYTQLMEANCVPDAKTILANQPNVSLIICDWHMPSETGLDFLRWIRSEPAYKNIPFIMLTTEQERSHILEAARIGLQGYIFKPVQKNLLQQKLTELGITPSVAEKA
jgi:two-component system chemotaxis response regulator CheY